MQVPGAKSVTVGDEIEHFVGVALENVTVSELVELAEAVKVSVPVVLVRLMSELNVIVCVRFLS